MNHGLSCFIAQQSSPPPSASPAGGAPPGGLLGMGPSVLMVVFVFGFMYFFILRPQRKEEKRKREMLSALKKGDPVITAAGIMGTVANVKDESVVLNVGDGVKIEFSRAAIQQLRESKSGGSAAKDK